MHKPIFTDDCLPVDGDFMKDEYDNNYPKIMNKWSTIAENTFSEFNFEKLNLGDRKLIIFYMQWLKIQESGTKESKLVENVHSFKKLIIKYINSHEMNFHILSEVYNPILNKVRYKVDKDGEHIIMDELTYVGEPFLIHLYPTKFLEGIGMKGYVRSKKLNEILGDADTV